MKPTLTKCWMVWCRRKQIPRALHRDKKSAVLEAWRLAVKHPNNSFVILEAVDVRRFDVDGVPK